MRRPHAVPNRNDLLDLDDETLMQYCRQENYKSSGPGGQHRNKTDSAVRISLLNSSLVALCSDHRSQHRNRKDALKRLRLAIATEIREPINPNKGSELWQGSWKLGKKDRRYAKFLAHLFDVLAHHEWAIGRSAETLGVSTGKLVRTLSRDPQAWNAVNQARVNLNLVNLRRP